MLKTSSVTNVGAANLELKACHDFYATAEQFHMCCPSESHSPSPECVGQEQVKPRSYVNDTGRSSGMWGVSSLLHPPQPPLEVVLHLVSMDMFSSYREIGNFDTKLLKQIVQSVHRIATLHMQLS